MYRLILAYCILMVCCVANAASNKLNIYSWSEYISPNSIKEFENATGIRVIYDVYDTDEVLDAKLLAGNLKYDIVFPSSGYLLANQIKLKSYIPLDKSKIPNYKNIDPDMLKILEKSDPNNAHAIPWMIGGIGVGYNEAAVKTIDPNAPLDSLELIFNPKYAEKFSKCGIAWFNFPAEMIGFALLYHGKDPNDLTAENMALAKSTIEGVRKHVRKIPSINYSTLVDDGICITVGWVGDIARARAKLPTHLQKQVKYFLPKEGFFIGIDSIAVPKTAENIDNAYKFINFLLDPKVAAENSNHTRFMNANKASQIYIEQNLIDDMAINIPRVGFKNAHVISAQSLATLRERNRMWTNILTGTN